MSPLTSVLVTGANAGLGKECSRQLSLLDGIKKIYLGCRNQDKADAAKAELEESTGKKVFQVLIIDVSNLESVRNAVNNLLEPIDGLVLNAGGAGGQDSMQKTADGVTAVTAVNVLGHVLLVDLLLEQKKLTTGTVVFSGSEAARGVKSMGMPKPEIKSGSVEEFASICDGTYDNGNTDFNLVYGAAKLLGIMWMGSMSRKVPEVRFVSMSPGASSGTEVMNGMAPAKKFMFTAFFKVFTLFGNAHDAQAGAKRYVDALTDDDKYKTGVFYASENGTAGPVCDQVKFRDDLKNEQYQDNANTAIRKFIK